MNDETNDSLDNGSGIDPLARVGEQASEWQEMLKELGRQRELELERQNLLAALMWERSVSGERKQSLVKLGRELEERLKSLKDQDNEERENTEEILKALKTKDIREELVKKVVEREEVKEIIDKRDIKEIVRVIEEIKIFIQEKNIKSTGENFPKAENADSTQLEMRKQLQDLKGRLEGEWKWLQDEQKRLDGEEKPLEEVQEKEQTNLLQRLMVKDALEALSDDRKIVNENIEAVENILGALETKEVGEALEKLENEKLREKLRETLGAIEDGELREKVLGVINGDKIITITKVIEATKEFIQKRDAASTNESLLEEKQTSYQEKNIKSTGENFPKAENADSTQLEMREQLHNLKDELEWEWPRLQNERKQLDDKEKLLKEPQKRLWGEPTNFVPQWRVQQDLSRLSDDRKIVNEVIETVEKILGALEIKGVEEALETLENEKLRKKLKEELGPIEDGELREKVLEIMSGKKVTPLIRVLEVTKEFIQKRDAESLNENLLEKNANGPQLEILQKKLAPLESQQKRMEKRQADLEGRLEWVKNNKSPQDVLDVEEELQDLFKDQKDNSVKIEELKEKIEEFNQEKKAESISEDFAKVEPGSVQIMQNAGRRSFCRY